MSGASATFHVKTADYNIGLGTLRRDSIVSNNRCCLITKRIVDLLGSILGLILVSPLMLFATILIKFTSRGPALLKQDRIGKDGRVFTMYKLRTMRVDAEAVTGPVWAKEDDPRATRVGAFLRKTHFDELPQIFNVLKGEMSLVGPRPERPIFVYEFNQTLDNYTKRLTVKPGITGWAQIRHEYHCSIKDVRRKLKYDIFYIKKMCLLVDLQILFMTVTMVLKEWARC